MSALLGVAIASAVTGRLSDRIGRKPVLQVCMGGSIFGNMLKWFLRFVSEPSQESEARMSNTISASKRHVLGLLRRELC